MTLTFSHWLGQILIMSAVVGAMIIIVSIVREPDLRERHIVRNIIVAWLTLILGVYLYAP